MTVVSTKEFLSNEDKYFGLAVNEDVFVQKGEIMFIIQQVKKQYLEPDDLRKKKQTCIQELILQAPTWSNDEYSDYLEVKKHIRQSRLQ